ncbi:MAG: DUF4249 family protein, partial [Bacteroidales bacterium]|nr:DUF4249 family protein [Bacteroidales bacterium]
LSAPDTATKNYMWQVIETFEVQTVYEIDGYWYEKALGVPEFDPVSDSINVCWKTEEISRWYTSSTRNLTVNEKKKIPLNYVSGFDPKLNIRYSILVKQFALSASAYEYHNLNNFMTSEGGLYSVQPPQSKCNIKNIHDPYETVLGYFWAASYTQKRIFYKGPFDNINLSHCNYVRPCIPPEGVSLLDFFRTINGSVFLIALEFDKDKPDSVTLWGYPPEQICIDCTTEGGVTEKPDFW